MKKRTTAKSEPGASFAQSLKAARAAAEMTQAQAADCLQVARRAVQQWEAGLRTPIYPAQVGALSLLKK